MLVPVTPAELKAIAKATKGRGYNIAITVTDDGDVAISTDTSNGGTMLALATLVNLRTSASPGEYTKIVGEDLHEGDRVLVECIVGERNQYGHMEARPIDGWNASDQYLWTHGTGAGRVDPWIRRIDKDAQEPANRLYPHRLRHEVQAVIKAVLTSWNENKHPMTTVERDVHQLTEAIISAAARAAREK